MILFHRFRALLALGIILLTNSLGVAQTLVRFPRNVDRTYGLGVRAAGAVVAFGEDDKFCSALWTYAGPQITLAYLTPLPGDVDARILAISRDARFATGLPRGENPDGVGLCWDLAVDTPPIAIFPPAGEPALGPTAVASTPNGPLVGGYFARESFVWSPLDGIRYWGPRIPTGRYRALFSMSAKGTMLGGVEGVVSSAGIFVSATGVIGSASDVKTLPRFSVVKAVSPNAKNLCVVVMTKAGEIRTAVWSRRFGLVVAPSGVNLRSIADSGLAAGSDLNGAVMFDPERRRHLESFDRWWVGEYPSRPLPAHVDAIRDLYEANDQDRKSVV